MYKHTLGKILDVQEEIKEELDCEFKEIINPVLDLKSNRSWETYNKLFEPLSDLDLNLNN